MDGSGCVDSKSEPALLGKRPPDATLDAALPPPAMRAGALAAAAVSKSSGENISGRLGTSGGCGEEGTMSLQQVLPRT